MQTTVKRQEEKNRWRIIKTVFDEEEWVCYFQCKWCKQMMQITQRTGRGQKEDRKKTGRKQQIKNNKHFKKEIKRLDVFFNKGDGNEYHKQYKQQEEEKKKTGRNNR